MKINPDFVFVMLLLIIPSVYATLTSDKVLAEDWNRAHSVWIDRYVHGDFTPFLEYPPFFHFAMIPFFVTMGDAIRWLQIPLSILAGFAGLFIARKYSGEKASILAGILLVSSIDFGLYSMGLQTQTLDYILMPLAMWALLEKKYKLSAIVLTMLMYNHMTAFFIFPMFLLYALFRDRKFLKYLILVALLSIPIMIAYWIPSFTDIYSSISSGRSDFARFGQFYTNDWFQFYITPFWHFFLFSGIPIWIFMPIVVFKYFKSKNMKLSNYEIMLILWIITFMPLFFFSILRWIAYIVFPIALLEADIIYRSVKK